MKKSNANQGYIFDKPNFNFLASMSHMMNMEKGKENA